MKHIAFAIFDFVVLCWFYYVGNLNQVVKVIQFESSHRITNILISIVNGILPSVGIIIGATIVLLTVLRILQVINSLLGIESNGDLTDSNSENTK